MRAATVAGALWLLGVGAQPEPRYICLEGIQSAAERQQNKEFCEAAEDQCFDLYNATRNESDILPFASCENGGCYCGGNQNDLKRYVLKVDSMPIDFKLGKQTFLGLPITEKNWDFSSLAAQSNYCVLASDVHNYISQLSDPTTVQMKLAAMALPLVESAGSPSLLTSTKFKTSTGPLQHGIITEGTSIMNLATGLQPAGSMALLFMSTTRPITYVVKGDISLPSSSIQTPLKPGATIGSVEINPASTGGIDSLAQCQSLEGLSVNALFTAPTAPSGTAYMLKKGYFFDIKSCLNDPLRCQDATFIYKQCTPCDDRTEIKTVDCNVYNDTVCVGRPTLAASNVALMLTDPPSPSSSTGTITAIIITLLVLVVLVIGIAIVGPKIKQWHRKKDESATKTPRLQSQGIGTHMYGSTNMYM